MTPYSPNIHHHRSIRLKGYDYSQSGLYFVTICVQDRACLFGEIIDGQMICNDAGTMVEIEWLKLPERFTNIHLHEYIVMPNHFHAILEIVGATLVVAQNETFAHNNYKDSQNDDDSQKGQPQRIAPTGKTVGDMVGVFQSIVTVEYIRGVKTLGWTPFNGKLWQFNYNEHIIRNEQSYLTISNYIIKNPAKWEDDKFYQQ
ncbi:MAG: transposase [Saprospiraceae bacterium]|nr:transposase [Candidatus Defluviibacterium haderslevense]